jgi:hypothetical protein
MSEPVIPNRQTGSVTDDNQASARGARLTPEETLLCNGPGRVISVESIGLPSQNFKIPCFRREIETAGKRAESILVIAISVTARMSNDSHF